MIYWREVGGPHQEEGHSDDGYTLAVWRLKNGWAWSCRSDALGWYERTGLEWSEIDARAAAEAAYADRFLQ